MGWLEFPDGQLRSQMTTSIMAGTTIDQYMMSNSWHAELGGLLALVFQRFINCGLTQGGGSLVDALLAAPRFEADELGIERDPSPPRPSDLS